MNLSDSVEKQLKVPKAFKSLFEPKRYKVYYGGRGGAKSHAIATALLMIAAQRKIRVLCARELQVSIGDSVHKLLCDIIAQYDLDAFYTITQTSIRGANGSEVLNKHTYAGYKPFYRTIIATYVSENEFRGI